MPVHFQLLQERFFSSSFRDDEEEVVYKIWLPPYTLVSNRQLPNYWLKMSRDANSLNGYTEQEVLVFKTFQRASGKGNWDKNSFTDDINHSFLAISFPFYSHKLYSR